MVRSKKSLVFKSIILLSIARWYNILLTAVAQYIAAFFIFNSWYNRWDMLMDIKLHLIVICTALFIAAGYIINFFYDKEVDLINHPRRTRLYMILNKEFLLRFYLGLIALGLILAFSASMRIGLFFFAFSFGLWFYSHKLKRIPYIREITATLLTVTSFFSITLHYGHITAEMFLYGVFIFFIILIREGIKDIENQRGNAVYAYYSATLINKPQQFLALLKALSTLELIPVLLFAWVAGPRHETFFVMSGIWLILLIAVLVLHRKYNADHAGLSNTLLKFAIVCSIMGLIWL